MKYSKLDRSKFGIYKSVTRDAFTDKLRDLKDKYRNVAAHTGKMSSDQARDCKMLVGKLLANIIGFGKKDIKSKIEES